MAGIVFFRTTKYDEIIRFYTETIGMKVWLKQKSCTILQHDNQLLGFCAGTKAETQGVITFFYENKEKVDVLYNTLKDIAISPPKQNPDYQIYHFYAIDPEGRSIEFQAFLHQVNPFHTATEVLKQRRSIRKYKPEPVPDELLNELFELCRWSPTARNLQNYYYIVIKNRIILQKIVEIRGPAGLPIISAPFAVAVCAKGEMHNRIIQDACIAAYHFMLSAKTYGLGTCWVTDMDKIEIKQLLDVPSDDYIACLTPIGYPDEEKPLPLRHQVKDFVKFL